jgi:hypothetical protein
LGIFRRREPLHAKLAREGGLELEGTSQTGNPASPGPELTRSPWDAAGIHGVHRAREWDVVTMAEAPDLHGERLEFVAISDVELVREGAEGELSPLTAAVERDVSRPYRAEAVRRERARWAVAARRIEIIRLPNVEGDELELSSHGGERTLMVDGEPQFGSVPALERDEHVVRAHRIGGDAFEVEVDPL